MATLGFAGLFVKLKDKRTGLEDRLKLLRFAWKSSDVFIPNKEQVLIDLLGSYLLDLKKDQSSEKDVCLVWSCLHDVLGTQRVQTPDGQRNELVVKQSLAQLITEALANMDKGRLSSLSITILGCCKAVITSPRLAHVYMCRLDLMLSVICSLCQLVTTDSQEMLDDVHQLLYGMADMFIKALRTAPNQNQILQSMCDKLLPILLPKWSDATDGCIKKAGEVFLAALTHKDHQHGLNLFLKSGQAEDKLNKRAKMASHVFATLEKFLHLETSDQCVHFLVGVFDSYVSHNCHDSNLQNSFNMLVQLCHLIGLSKDSAALSGVVPPQTVVKGVNQLLLFVQRHDLYSVTADDGNRQLAYYRHLAKTVVDLKCICSDWFSTLTVLLQLNHQIVEPVLKEVLIAGWVEDKSEDCGKTLEAMDMFLEEVILTYNKLRQIPKVITKLLECLCGSHRNKPITLTTRFIRSFGDVTQALPQGVMVDIWKMFVQAIKETFVDRNKKELKTGHFQAVVCLFHHWMMNIKVADYSVTEITSKNVQELMMTMETEVLYPLLHAEMDTKKEEEDHLLYALHLCHSWGELAAMLALYKQFRVSHLQTCELALYPHDLSYLHRYLSKEQWRVVHKRIQKTDSAALWFAWDVLLVQKARTLLLFRDPSSWTIVRDTLTTVLTLPKKLTQAVAIATWKKSLTDVNEENVVLARWHLLTTNLGMVQCALGTEQLQKIAGFVLQSYFSQPSPKQDGVSLHDLTEAFLLSLWVRESSGLQCQLVTAALTSLRDCFKASVPKTKKRKSSSGLSTVYKLLDTLSSDDIDWTKGTNSEVDENMREVGQCLTAMFEDTDRLTSMPHMPTINVALQVLKRLPVAEMASCDQTRCLTGLLSLLVVLNKCEAQSGADLTDREVQCVDRESVISCCVELCTVLLDSGSSDKTFTVVPTEAFLNWLSVQTTTLDKGSAGYRKLLLMMKVACNSVLSTKDVSRLEKLLPWVNQLCCKMLTDPQADSMEGMLSLSCFLLQTVSKILSRTYLREDIQAVCTAIYLDLSKRLLELSPLISNSSAEAQAALLVQCYSNILMVYFVQDEVKAAFLDKFPDALRCCKDLIQTCMGSDDLSVKMCALNFLHSISKYHHLLDSVYTSSMKLDIWLILVDLLKNILINQSQTGSSNIEQAAQSQTSTASNPTYQKQTGQSHPDSSCSPTHKKKTSQSNIRNVQDQLVTSKGSDVDGKIKAKVDLFNSLLQGDVSTKDGNQLTPSGLSSAGMSNVDFMTLSDRVMQHSAVTQLYYSLVFEDKLAGNETKILLELVQNVMAELLASLQMEDFSKIVFKLVEDVHYNLLLTDLTRIKSSLYIWRQLLLLEFSDEQVKILQRSAKTMMINFQCILQQLHHHRDQMVVMDIVVPILNTQQQILKLSHKFLPSQMNLLCLHSCAYAPLCGRSYFPVFHAVCDILDTLLVQHEKAVLENIPSFIGCAKKLLLSVVHQSSQDLVSQDTQVISGLKNCAYNMERLFTLISTHKVEFGKVAPYVVADYVTAIQKVTIQPVIKRALVPAVYKMFDLCDRHSVAQLHTVLSHGVIDVFKILYNEYCKFHKYSGKI